MGSEMCIRDRINLAAIFGWEIARVVSFFFVLLLVLHRVVIFLLTLLVLHRVVSFFPSRC